MFTNWQIYLPLLRKIFPRFCLCVTTKTRSSKRISRYFSEIDLVNNTNPRTRMHNSNGQPLLRASASQLVNKWKYHHWGFGFWQKGVCRCQTNHISAVRGVPFPKLRPTADYGDLVNWLKKRLCCRIRTSRWWPCPHPGISKRDFIGFLVPPEVDFLCWPGMWALQIRTWNSLRACHSSLAQFINSMFSTSKTFTITL